MTFTDISLVQTAFGASVCAALISYAIYRTRLTPLSTMPGPENHSWLWGNLPQILDPNVHGSSFVDEWIDRYGQSFSVHGFLSVRRLYTVDPKAISSILSRASDFPKPWQSIQGIQKVTGEGVLAAEGDVHKRQVCAGCVSS